jgi:phosphoribosylaminoimidazole carboxylase
MSNLKKNKVVGILGGGQLGRMMAIAAHNLGEISVVALDPGGDESPTGQVCGQNPNHDIPKSVQGSFKDPEAIRTLASVADVLTVEIEHVNCDVLDELVAEGLPVYPSPDCIRIIQDKLKQKQHFSSAGVNLAPFRPVANQAELSSVGEEYGYPFMLKARYGAYDGKGNAVVESAEGIAAAYESLGGNTGSTGDGCYAEKWCPFIKELAVMVVRTVSGDVIPYPVVEFTSRNNVCHTTLCPARITKEQETLAKKVACQAVGCLPGAVGVFGVEMFAMPDGNVALNEIAPRPHNSGHYTIEACGCSQFESHLRAVAGLNPPLDVNLRVGASVMINILGRNGSMEETMSEFTRLSAVPGAGPHWYGKTASRPGRKMGHVTVNGSSIVDLAQRLSSVVDLIGQDGMPTEGSNSETKSGSNSINKQVDVCVIMGSDSDLPCMIAACDILDDFKVSYEVSIVSAHRTPERMVQYATDALDRGVKCIIAGAGGAAHLPGMVAAMTPLPVIGVPVKTSALSGVDSLYSIVQMPRGVPVATVAIGNAKNAGLLAVRMIAGCTRNMRLIKLLNDFRTKGREEQEAKAAKLEQLGAKAYLDGKKNKSTTVM